MHPIAAAHSPNAARPAVTGVTQIAIGPTSASGRKTKNNEEGTFERGQPRPSNFVCYFAALGSKVDVAKDLVL